MIQYIQILFTALILSSCAGVPTSQAHKPATNCIKYVSETEALALQLMEAGSASPYGGELFNKGLDLYINNKIKANEFGISPLTVPIKIPCQ